MIDLNTLISNALTAAVQQAVAPLVERIAALEGDVSHKVQVQQANITAALAERIAALELQRGEMQRTIVTYSERISALENNPAQGVDMTLEQRVAALESETQGDNRYLNRDDVASLIEEAMDDHCSTYDHDDYDNHIGDDDKHFEGDIEDAVRDALSNMTFDVSIR